MPVTSSGACSFGIGQVEEAIKTFERVLEIDPTYVMAQFNIFGGHV